VTFTGVDANGQSKSFPAVQGATTDGIVIGNGALTNYTFCHVARYTGATKDRIFAGTTGNWLSGFWSGATGVAYHEGWITASTGTNDLNWKIQCDTGGSRSSLRSDGVLKSSIANNATGLPANISINLQGSRIAPSGLSDWAVAEFVIYDSVLSEAKIKEIEERLNRKYKVGLFTPTIHTYNYASTGDITLYAQWNSTITYDGNGQTSASSTVPAPTIAKGTAANTTLANAGTMVKTGYTFGGWNTQADGAGTNYASGLTTYQSAGNVTLYAKWTRTITYNSNGANSGSPERAIDVFVNSTTPSISTFPNVGTMVRTGYTFAGWVTTTGGTTLLTTPYATTGEVTLYARWTANTYTIVYDTSTVTSGTMADTSFTAGTAFSLRANAFAKTGYTFKNWNTVANGSGTTYTNSQSVTLYGGFTLYPQWTLVAPGVPTVSVSAGNTEVTVTPTPAAASGTTVGATTSMLVTAYTNAGAALSPAKTCTVVSPATNCVITGLTNGTAYKFAATATNATSTSASSTQVSGTPAGVIVTFDATTNSGALPQFSVTNTQVTSQVATLTTSSPHSFTVGTKVVVVCSDTRFAGTFVITAVPSATTFSYPLSYVNLAFTTVTGTATLASTATYNKGSALILPSATKSGYTFSGWYTTASNSPTAGSVIGSAGASYSPANAITLFARFAGIVYTISYNGNGNGAGTVPATGSFETGGTAYSILGGTNSPSRVGYTFAGWNTKADGTGTDYAVNASYSTNADLSLFAKWTAASRTVTYALDGGTSSANTSQLTGKVVGNTVTLPASNTMTKSGYTFAGWSDGTSTYSGGATWTVPASDSNFTLTALWNTQTFTYSYDTNGGGTAPSGGTKTYGESLVLAASTGLSKTGYTFAGWNDGSTTINAGTSVSITTNKIYVAQWSAQSFTISYSGNSPTSGSVTSGSYVAGGVPYAIAANGFTKVGYTFAGWKDASNNSYAVGSGYSSAADLVLTAQWTASSFTVSYNTNGATAGSAPADGAFTTGASFSTSTNSGNLVKSGYTFAGWNTSAAGTGTSYGENSALTTTANITLFAKWTIISPLITFNQGSATTTPSVFPANTSAQYGSLYTLPTTDTSTVISSVIQIFTGWSDGTNTYAIGDTYRIGTTNVTFTAQWVAVYTVRYVLNGGSGTVPADILRTNAFAETLTSATVSKTGFTLTGWKDQSGVTIPSGANNWSISGSSYVAYAQWSPTQRTLSFDVNGGSGAESSITGKVIGDLVTLPTPSSTKTGYTFGGWSSSGTTYPAGGTFTVGDGNASFTAVWVGNVNTITYNGNGATGGTVPASGNYVSGDSTPYTVSGNTGSIVKSGFTFDGWYTNPNGSSGTAYAAGTGTLTTTSNLTLYAKWTASTYAVTYNTDGGSLAPTQSDTMYGASFTLPVAPTKSGSNFLGWETGTGASANLFAPGASYVMGSSAVTFIARWSGISYAVTYALNGGAGTTPTQANVSSGGSFTTAATPTKTGFTFTGWSDGATTTNASTLISNVSGNITLTAQWTISAPGIPGTPAATPGNGSATITIAAPASGGTPSSYTVTASPGGATCTVVAPGTSCTIAPLTNGTAYTFTSSATNSAGSSASASTSSAAVTPAGVPSTPSGVSGTGTGGTINVGWTVPTSDGGSAITDYIVEYSVAGSGTWTTFAEGTSTATSATVSGLTAGTAYEFRVTAKNIIGNSLPSFSSPTIETLPTAPTITGVTSASEQVTVTWNAPSHLGSGTITGDEYVVTAYDASGNEAGSCKPTSGQRTCVVTGLDNGSAYTFKVAVVTTVGTSAQSVASATAIPAGVPSAPANVAAVTSGSNMTVTFDAPADNGGSAITSYAVTSSPSGATCTVGANATTYICTGLTAGTNYTYSVKAVNSKGQSSASLDSTAVTAVAAPSAPQNVSAVITAGSTTLSATVSFDPPSTDNGSAVISYRVTASPGGATCTVTAPTTYCDIPVLPDRVYTFTVTATNAVGTSVSSSASLETKAANGIAPTLVVDPIPAPTGDLIENKVLSSNITFADFNSTPNSVVTYQWKRCTDPLDDTTCTSISGATSATYTLGAGDVDKYIRVAVTATNSIGTVTKLSEATEIIVAAPVAPTPSSPSTPSAPSTPVIDPTPSTPSCDSACQAIKDAAAAKAIADAAAKAAADKLAADAAAKLKADAAATTASTKAAADAAAAAAAAKAAVEKAGAAAAAKAAADAAAAIAAAQAKAAADAQASANKAAAAAAAALKNSTVTAAAKAAATAAANKAAADAAAAVKAAATAATAAAKAQTTAANATKQVDIAINSLTSKTAASQASAQANAIAAAAKAAANEAAAAAAAKAAEAKAAATTAQKAAADTAARIATEQKQAATAAAQAKAAADAAAKAIADKITADTVATKATQELAKVLEEKAALAEQAAKASDELARTEIQKKIEEVSAKAEEVQKSVEVATAKVEEATSIQSSATQTAEAATKEAQTQAAEAIAIKAESVAKTAAATKATAAATVAAKVATAAKAAAAKVPSKAVITTKPSTSTSKNSATATVTGLKPGQKVKVTVNVKDK
jgi:uncharacterized repeat protein (TIGR02543 family)